MSRMAKASVADRAGWRSALLLVVFALAVLALEGRIVYLQVVDRDFLAEQANDRHLRTQQISAHRGSLTDRRGEPLAVSTPVDTIYANPQELKAALDRLGELAAALDQDEEWLARRITSNLAREFVYLERQALPARVAKVLALGLPGVYTVREYRRFYPAGEVTAHVLGFTDVDDHGLEGLEAAYDHYLKGEKGAKRVLQDQRGTIIKDVELLAPARPGRDLRTSLDLRLQYLAYRELKAAVTASRARSGSVVILDPGTGEVLAMVNQPSYNPNDRAQYGVETYRNRAVTDMFEPGSTFKPFVMAEALDSGDYTPSSVIDSLGALVVNDRILTVEGADLGRVSLTTVLAQSSNVGAARIALTREPHAIWDVLSGFGIGRLTDSAFPGESAGTLNDPQHWCRACQATLSYGYGVNVTALQLARAYAVIASGGTRKPVSLLALDEPPRGERVVSAETARELTMMLKAVVSPGGTGQRAAVHNFHVAGKTGTSQKAAAGGYSDDHHAAIFAGFAPASQPRFVVVVMIDEPKGAYYGGDVAAPVFANIVSGALRVHAVPPDALAAPTMAAVADLRVRP